MIYTLTRDYPLLFCGTLPIFEGSSDEHDLHFSKESSQHSDTIVIGVIRAKINLKSLPAQKQPPANGIIKYRSDSKQALVFIFETLAIVRYNSPK